jgi:hypothetical protein
MKITSSFPILPRKTWFSLILLGFAGQLAWGVEKQYFNTFLYDNIIQDLGPISWMVAAIAVTATITTILDEQPGFIPTPLIIQAAGLATLVALFSLAFIKERRDVVR